MFLIDLLTHIAFAPIFIIAAAIFLLPASRVLRMMLKSFKKTFSSISH